MTAPIQTENAVLVEVPTANEMKYTVQNNPPDDLLMLPCRSTVICWLGIGIAHAITLPLGNYEILGLASEVPDDIIIPLFETTETLGLLNLYAILKENNFLPSSTLVLRKIK